MPKFRKRPVAIEADQYIAEQHEPRGLCWTLGHGVDCPHVHTIHQGQTVAVRDQDWIVPEPDGEHFYPVKPDIFEATYEPMADEVTV